MSNQLECFQEKWKPVFRPEARDNINLGSDFDSVKVDKILVRLNRSRFCCVSILLIAAMLSGCASSRVDSTARFGDVPLRAYVDGVPLIEQEDDYCGPAALAMVLSWSGTPIAQADIAAQVFSPGAGGTYRADLIGGTRRHGRLAVEVSNFADLAREIDAGHPVIVFQNLGLRWLPKWHYSVVVGYDLESGQMFLHSGEHTRVTMELSLFERTWARADNWALVVLPPDLLPASADQWKVLKAAAALEQVIDPVAAAALYKAGGEKWQDQWIWPFGLGNSLYREGNLTGAKDAFESALAIDPTADEAARNLAGVELELEQASAGL